MTVPAPVVEMYLGGSWINLSGWVDLGDDGAALAITRGRENEQSDIDAGTCSFSLVNDDGRFTLANTSGAYSPNFKLWVQVRVTVAGVREFTGYMSQAESAWDDDTGLHSHTSVTCTDLIGMMAMSPTVTSWAESLIGDLSPSQWWPLNDPEGSTEAASATGGPALVASMYGTGDPASPPVISDVLQFGAESTLGSMESDTQMMLTPHYSNLAVDDYDASVIMISTSTITLPTTCTVLAVVTAPADYESEANAFAAGALSSGGWTIWEVAKAAGSALFLTRNGRNLWLYGISATSAQSSATAVNFFTRGVPSLVAVVVTPTSVSVLGTAVSMSYPSGWAAPSPASVIAATATAGALSNIAVISGAMTLADFNTLKANLLGDGSAAVSSWLNRAASEAGYASSVAATFDRTMQRPVLKGSNPAEAGNTLANSAASAFAADKSGVPTWYDFSYCPARIVIATGEWDRSTTWAPDSSLYYSEVQFDGVVAGTVAGAWPRRALDVAGLLPDADEAGLARWYVNAQDVITGPRLSELTIDMLTAASPSTYQAIDLKSRINLQSAAPQIPTASVMTVEGYTTTITKDSWTLKLSTAPDPRFVLGDAISGVLGSNYRIAPLRP